MADDLLINPRVTIPGAELEFTASRASGPGGQHVNTSDTRIQVRWNVVESQALGPVQRQRVLRALASRLTTTGEIILASGAQRSQRRNREDVTQRLAQMVREALVPPKPRRATRPTAASRRRRLEDKRRQGKKKKDRGGGHDPSD